MRVQKSYYSGAAASGTLGGPASTSGLATSSSISATAAAGAPVATTSSPTQTAGVGDVLTMYRYDGQMLMESYAAHDDGSSVLTDHGLGGRGVDYVQVQSLSTSGQLTTTVGFPLYDGHGNEVATIQRSGSNYVIGNQRGYGAWGEIRQGVTTGGPRGRYCGNLGHVQDDETGLIYMRARYYEPGSGRFISEDSARHRANWCLYSDNDSVNRIDTSGNEDKAVSWRGVIAGILSLLAGAALSKVGLVMAIADSAFLVLWFGEDALNGNWGNRQEHTGTGVVALTLYSIFFWCDGLPELDCRRHGEFSVPHDEDPKSCVSVRRLLGRVRGYEGNDLSRVGSASHGALGCKLWRCDDRVLRLS